MKVLFAVSNEEISEAIVKRYQKEYKQIISYKNVYYFNAILKEIQKDKTYDRIVISEDLETFTHTQYDQIDKFIFEKLDSISDEASNVKGNDIPIILICSDRRNKSEEILVKLFGIGIYNAIIGTDRSIEEVCRLINRPRVKKEAKTYYKIDSEDVNYKPENENDVSEMEIQNIVAYYKRLGKDEEKYVESFDNNIAKQYNDTQLRIISKFLPLNVRAVLEEQSPKYQQIMSFNNSVSNTLRKKKEEEDKGTSEILLKLKNKEVLMSKPVVIPSSVNLSSTKKLARTKRTVKQEEQNGVEIEEKAPVAQPTTRQQQVTSNPVQAQNRRQEQLQPIQEVQPQARLKIPQTQNSQEINTDIEEVTKQAIPEEPIVQPVKRGRGRPRKNPIIETTTTTQSNTVKRGRGRPRKVEEKAILPKIEKEENTNSQLQENILPGYEQEEQIQEEPDNNIQNNILPGFDYEEENYTQNTQNEQNILPGFEDEEENYETNNNYKEYEENILPGFDEEAEQLRVAEPTSNYKVEYEPGKENIEEIDENIDLTRLLTPDKKIVTFVGTSKNGTSFIVNNIARLMANNGVNTAILDTTKNRNSYYIYTKNEEELRNVAINSIKGLQNGIANGINVSNNLTVYTSLPDENDGIARAGKNLETLLTKHSLILIDTDFSTPLNYFKYSQETYLVQSLDILTIQPLTAFLRELKAKNILDESKLKIILNKFVKLRGINEKTIIGGMAYYNDPSMTYMIELFDRNLIKYISIPFDEEVYIKYLEDIVNCDINLKGYTKSFMQILGNLGDMIYTTVNTQKTYKPPTIQTNGFTPSINNTLDQMKKRY